MKTLVDTCVLSEVQRPKGNPRVREKIAAIDDQDFYLSVITIGEIVKGIERLEPGRRKDELAAWIRDIEDHHANRILAIDARTVRIWGELTAHAHDVGVTIPAADGLIAATALRHDFVVMTRNSEHFEASGARLVNPWNDE